MLTYSWMIGTGHWLLATGRWLTEVAEKKITTE
jgi:hypothetical protein